MKYLNKEQTKLLNKMADKISALDDDMLMNVIAGMAKKKDAPEYDTIMASLLGEYMVRNGEEKTDMVMGQIGW